MRNVPFRCLLLSQILLDTVMASRQESDIPRKPNLWRENHGNFLAAFASLVLILGTITILYQQMRFRPPAFPRHLPSPADPSAVPGDGSNTTLPGPFDEDAVDDLAPVEDESAVDEDRAAEPI